MYMYVCVYINSVCVLVVYWEITWIDVHNVPSPYKKHRVIAAMIYL